ncbi:MAG: alpha-N-arabinofuranosidase [Oscillospiraceae bacterium]|nr:alpha-N-arabinofuranosidase [Oscillospiraceae bacterium]
MKQFRMLINAADTIGHIEPEIYGHFAEHLGRCIYQGIYVGEDSPIPNTYGIRNDVIAAFRQIHMPVLRWPGGCFADEYHWKDGIGEKSARRKMINTNWGGVTEDNSFGTHEFMTLCELVGCEPYITGNVGSGTVQELSEWVEYVTFDGVSPMAELRRANGREKPWRLKYLGIGNENWGCGGNMRPEYYADVYRRYQSFCKNYSGNQLYRIACGPSCGDWHWTEVMMQNLNPTQTDAIALHFYSIPDWEHKGSATEFTDDEYYAIVESAAYMETLLQMHTQIMERYDPENRIALVVDEWGTWYDVELGTHPGFLYQQNTMRDAMTASLTLNLFNRHSRRVKMANLAQAVNVLQALLLTEGEKLVKTPTFHVFDLFKAHQGGDAVYCFTENAPLCEGKNVPMLSCSASVKDGVLTLTAANLSLHEEAEILCDVCNLDVSDVSARILTQEVHAHNDFDAPERVTIVPHPAALQNGKLHITLPPCSVTAVTLK